MNNKIFVVVLGGVVLGIISVLNSLTNFIPAFLFPLVTALYGVSILYMSR